MQTLKFDDFRGGWIPGQDAVRGQKNALVRMDNLHLDEYGALNLMRGMRLVNPDQFLGGVHTIYSRQLGSTLYRYVGLTDGSVIRDDGAGDFGTVINLAGNGSTTRAAFGAGFNYVFIVSGNGSTSRKTKDLGASHVNLGVETPLSAIQSSSKTTPELTIPDSYAVTLAEGANVATGADYFTADTDPGTFRVDAYKTFASDKDTMDFGSSNFGTDDDFYLFSVRIPDLTKLLRIQLVLYFGTVDAAPDTSPDLTDYYALEFLNTDAQFIRDGEDQWSTLGGHRKAFTRVGSNASKNWTNVKGMRVIATFSESVEGFGFAKLRVVGGSKGPLTGKYEYRQVNVNDTGTYIAKSASSPAQSHSTEVYHSAATIIPDIGASDAQINQMWFFRRKMDSLGADPLAKFLLCKVIEAYNNTPWDDVLDDIEIQQLNIALNESLISLNDSLFPHDVTYMEVNYFERTLYMTARDVWISDPLNPDAVDTRFTIRLSGDNFERNLWMTKIGPSTILVGTTNDIYEIAGDLTELPDGSMNVTVRGLGVKQAPTQDAFCVHGATLFYIANDGIRKLTGTANETVNTWTDLLWDNRTRYGILPIDKGVANSSKFSLAVKNNKLFLQVTLTDESRVLLYKDLIKDYWGLYYTNPACLFVEESGKLLAGYSASADFAIREIDVLTGIDSTSVGQTMNLRTPVLEDNLPMNRKDSFTLRLKIDTGGVDITCKIYKDEAAVATLVTATLNANGLTEFNIDISGSIGIVKSWQLELISTNLLQFKLTEFAIEYEVRPKQTLYLRIPPSNYGRAGRKRIPTFPILIDTLGSDVTFTPIIDGVTQTPSTVNTSDKQVHNHFFTAEKTGYTVGGILVGASLFEFYELIQPQIHEILPDPTKYLHIPFTDLGTQSRKRFIAFAFIINTNGANVTFTPVVDGVTGTPSTVNKNGKLTYIHYFTSDTVGTDIGGILSGSSQFEFYGVNLDECISEKMPSPTKFLLIPQDDYGTPARKRFSSYKFRINTKGQNVTFTPRIDGVNKTPSTINTTEPTVVEHFFTDEDVIGINIGGKLSGNTEFEFYGPLRPRVVEELPDRLKFFVIPENNFGIAAKKRIRTIPLVINTNGEDVEFTPIIDGVAGTPTTFNTPSKRTVLHYFTNDSFGIDYKGTLDANGTEPFEFYGMLKPEDVQIIPVGKKFDQLGPIEFPKIGKILRFRIRIIPTGTSLTYTMYDEDEQIGSPGTITTVANADQVVEVSLPKGIKATVFRIELVSADVFHRYYARFEVNYSGMEAEPKWVLFGADPDAKVK